MLDYLEKVDYLQERLSEAYLNSRPPNSIIPSFFRNVNTVILYNLFIVNLQYVSSTQQYDIIT